MSPCKVRFASQTELDELAKVPKPKKEPKNYDRSPMFRKHGPGRLRIAGSGWQSR